MVRSMDKLKPRVLVIADFLFPDYLGGSARFASNLNDALADLNHSVTCITRVKKGVFSSKIQSYNKYRLVKLYNILLLYKILLRERWDFIITHHYLLGSLSHFLLSKKQNTIIFFMGQFIMKVLQTKKIRYFQKLSP